MYVCTYVCMYVNIYIYRYMSLLVYDCIVYVQLACKHVRVCVCVCVS